MGFQSNFADELNSVHFSALKGSIYHSLRASFFTRWWIFSVFIALFVGLGSIALASDIFITAFFPLDETSFGLACFAFFVSFFGFLFDFTNKRRFHESLSYRWKGLVKALDDKFSEAKGISAKDYELFIKEYNSIVRDEPLIYFGLDAISYNIVSKSYGYSEELIIPYKVSLLKHYCKFLGRKFSPAPKRKQKTKARKGK